MKTIVLITRENSERTTHVSVFLCGSYSEANHFCHFVNRLPFAGEEKLVARKITDNAEYSLEKYQPFCFDDFVKLDDRTIQHCMREMDSQIPTVALKNAKKEVKDKFFRNLSKRAASMLKEDMEYMEPVTESDIENARRLILDIYDDLSRENRFDEAWAKYKNLKESKTMNQDDYDDGNHIVLVFRGAGTAADCVSVYLFDEYNSADNFCYYLNNLEQDKDAFFFAIHADQMTEYETTKPLLVSFNQIFDYIRLHGEFNGARVIREALKKFSTNTLLQALKGLDKRSRMIFMQCLPIKTRDELNENIESCDNCFFSSSQSRQAQQRMIDAINRTVDKFRQNKFHQAEIIKD